MSVVTVEPLAVANRLRPALLKLARELRRESHALGVTGGQVSLLFQIQRHRGIGVRDLAQLERISAAAMSGHVDRLERAGLVLRSVKSRRTAWLASRLERLSPGELAAVDAAVEPLLALIADDQ